jgi:hypothetical protein
MMRRRGFFTILVVFFVLFSSIGSIPVKASTNGGITSISVKKNILVPEWQTISISMEDSSLIQSLNINYQLANGMHTQYYMGRNNQGVFEGYAPTTYNDAGTTKVTSIFVNYRDGSFKVLEDIDEGGTYDLSAGDYTVHASDTTGPVFNGVSVNNTRVSTGNTLTVTVNAEDLLSGIQEVRLEYKRPDGMYVQEVAASIGNNQYQAQIPWAYTDGKYELASISLKDDKGNYTHLLDYGTYNPYGNTELNSGDFMVVPEWDAPTVKSISIDRNEISSGESVKLTAEVEDTSGAAEVKATFEDPNGSSYTAIFSHSHDNIYVAEIPGYMTQYTLGVWKPTFVWVEDIYENSNYNWSNLIFSWGVDLSHLTFNVKEGDVTPPSAPSVYSFDEYSTILSGYSEAGATVTAYVNGNIIGSAVADTYGYYQMYIGRQVAYTQILIYATDASGNVSPYTSAEVRDATPPNAPSVNTITDKDTTVTGQAEPGSKVVVRFNNTWLGDGIADAYGQFSVGITAQPAKTELLISASDKVGNRSEFTIVQVKDATPPAKPIVNEVNDQTTKVTGTTEANAEVMIKVGTNVISSGNADASGNFSLSITKQKSGTALLVIAKDQSGNESKTEVVTKTSYSPIKVQLNSKDFNAGYYGNKTTYVNWMALNVLKIPFADKGNGLFNIEGRMVQAESINGDWYIRWSQLSPDKITYKTITGGYNFIYTTPINIQLNGKDFSFGGYFKNNTTYVNWNALKTLNIPFTNKGNGVFLIEGRTVQAETIKGDWYIQWNLLSPDRIIYKGITGGYNFIYVKPLKVQLNGKDFTQGGYYMNNTTYVNWNALKTLNIPYTYKGNGEFLIEGRTVRAEAIKGDWYIQWKSLSPEYLIYKGITGGYNFIYFKPLNIQLNGIDFALGGYYMNNTTYVNWNALKTLNIPYNYKGNGVFIIGGRTVQAEAIKGDWYIRWSQLSPGKITYKTIKDGYNFIFQP